MAREKKTMDSPDDSGSWMNTYADMVTLLLTFFILLYSMSSVDSSKFNMLVTAFSSDGESSDIVIIRGEATGDEQKGIPLEEGSLSEDDMEGIFQLLQEAIGSQGLEDSVQVAMGDGEVLVRFMDNMLFEPNSSTLLAKDREILGFIGDALKSVQDSTSSITIVGHTAAIPDNPDYEVSDRLLSAERANRVLVYFEDEVGIDGSKLFATAYGKWKPIASNDTPEGMQKNRRVEILVSSENYSLSEQLDNVYEKLVE